MSEVISLLRDLVAIDSTSTKSNVPLIDALDRRLTALGLVTERQRYVDDAGVEKQNLLATAGQGTPELALVGHSDCVPFDAGWTEALALTERDGLLYGRGACDTKAFIACAVIAMTRVKAKLSKPAMLVFTADEELGCVGAKKLLEAGKGRARRALVGEPTSLRPIRANKGYCLAEVEVHGKEGHSAYPDTGASAVFRAARFLSKLEQYSRTTLREQTDAAFVPPFGTLNVGLVSGGKAKNVIPGLVRFTLEWRPLPGQDVNVVLDAVERLRRECVADEPAFTMTVKPLRLDRGFATAPDADLVTFVSAQTGKAPDTVAFGTEGPQLAALGAVPVVFGPGDITVAHQTGEHVPVAELLRCAEVMEAALLHFAG
ncbi:MAG: acetylornithine deacetylase [Myxococcaceae bacterium]|nr:acetylornithine deacetylase [Myxococcaceae bacterium]